MEFSNLEAFLAVADTASFSKAAERLALTQPAVSKRIANLEASLGVQLFDRIGRDIHLTESGEQLTDRAKRILQDIQDTRLAIIQSTNSRISQIALASSHHIGLHYLPPLLGKLRQEHPDIALDLRFLESEQTLSAILQRELELAFITLPRRLHKDLLAETLWQDELHFVVAKHHPLAIRNRTIRLNELTHLQAILPQPNTTTFQLLQAVFERHRLPLKNCLAVNYLETIRALVASGLGWSLLPTTLIDKSLAVLNLEDLQLTRSLGVIRHNQRTLSRGALELLNLARATTGQNH